MCLLLLLKVSLCKICFLFGEFGDSFLMVFNWIFGLLLVWEGVKNWLNIILFKLGYGLFIGLCFM